MGMFDELVNTVFDMDEEKRADMARLGVVKIMEWAQDNGKDGAELVLDYFKLFVSADQSCDWQERELFIKALGIDISSEQFYELTNHGANSDFIEKMVALTNKMDKETKQYVIILGIVILCADDRATVAEQKLLYRLFE